MRNPPPPVSTRYAVHVLGCKVSRIDALAAAGRLEEDGAAPAEGSVPADVVFVQTCTVTNRADRDGRRLLRRLKRENPRAVVVAAGCLAQRDPEGLARMPEVDLVLGHGEAAAVARHLRDRDAGLLPGKIVWSAAASHRESDALVLGVDPDRTRAFLKLQDGCERRCAFCVVPSVRGPERSAPPLEVEERIRRLGDEGVPEVVLAGVHLANYGKDRGSTLLDLLSRLEADPPACRVRLSSLEPMEAGGALLDLVSRSRVVVPHLHLPLQSGSDAVLRRMRRGITASRYLALAARALANPRLHLATDLVVGFPGETAEEFEETVALVEATRFASLHVFPFSPRSGTHGAVLHEASAVPDAVVTDRTERLRDLGDEKARAFARAADGTTAEVVTLRGGRGLTDHYLDVDIAAEGPPPAPGRRFPARLRLREDGSLAAAADPFPG